MRFFLNLSNTLRKHTLLRFLAGGILNTAVTYGVFLLGNLVLPYQVAYFLAYVVGIIFSYYFNSIVVFKSALSVKKFLAFPLVYVGQYAVSALLLEVFVSTMSLPVTYAPLAVIFITVPLTFVFSRLILAGKSKE